MLADFESCAKRIIEKQIIMLGGTININPLFLYTIEGLHNSFKIFKRIYSDIYTVAYIIYEPKLNISL